MAVKQAFIWHDIACLCCKCW